MHVRMFLSAAALIFTFTAVGRAVPETYKKGGVAVLSPGSVSGSITAVIWKRGQDIAVEWYGEETTTYQYFRGHCELNTTTGELMISNLSVKDSGSYTAEINNRVTKTTEIKVITAVPKPTISTHCNPEETQCTLTCDASITRNTGAISYSWEIGDRHIPDSPSNWIDITKNDTDLLGKPISCQLENPVSRARSDDIRSPFTPNRRSEGVNKPAVLPVVLIVVFVVIVAALAGLVFWDKHRQQNAHESWRQYFARFDPRSCQNPERSRGTQRSTNGAVTGRDYHTVPTQDRDLESVSQEPRNEVETSAVAPNAEEPPDHHHQQEDETTEE
ncbi:carcinoembryonic antigen-related cell adhesion molecule 1-like [Archocentrus centrarchus]|uniref:carcinoembryonic antigen-related cell adhesion molecule 1-like n=1 Tax=Archocentrus centrarchus TaxID=63155 RepID=UPI0011EA0A06|nr:carcinoembryonic antigen-related cell adhesion molecule 1-like [Archocentrus centrarchus]